MSASLKFLWSYPVDGGGVGDHLMRGSRIPDFGYYMLVAIAELQLVGWGVGSTIDFKTEGGTMVYPGIDSTYSTGTAPDFYSSPGTSITGLHLPPAEFMLMTINNADLTGGQLELTMEFVEF